MAIVGGRMRSTAHVRVLGGGEAQSTKPKLYATLEEKEEPALLTPSREIGGFEDGQSLVAAR